MDNEFDNVYELDCDIVIHKTVKEVWLIGESEVTLMYEEERLTEFNE